MNLTRALEVALPDIPARKLAESYPRLDPGTTFREHIEDGRPMVRIYVRRRSRFSAARDDGPGASGKRPL